MTKDAVCGMDVDEKEAKKGNLSSEHKGKTYYFCSEACKEEFEKDPQQHMKKKVHKSKA